jgi:hypothetical protein
MKLPLWKKRVFCNWAYNLVFELQWPFATHFIFTPMNVIGQVAWITRNTTRFIYNLTLMQLSCNSITTTFQLLCNSLMTTTIMSYWCHFSSIHQNLTQSIMKFLGDFFWNIDIHCPLLLFILNYLKLWHVAQSKVAMWHINWILETNIYKYLGRLGHSHK